MSTLYFRVESDWEEVQRLRIEIERLKTSLKGINANMQPETARQLSSQLGVLTKQYDTMVSKASIAGAKIDKTLIASQNAAAKSALNLSGGLKALGVTLLGGMGLQAFASQIMNVRGQFQQMEQSMKTMLGSEEKATALMGKIKEFAKISPLDMKSTVAAAQMMLGFNIEAEKVPKFLQAIGDVSAGNAQRFNSLTLAFSQMSATGKLMGQDLNQMINAGFNPLSEMARTTGKSIAQLKEEMSKGAISAEMIQNAFISATSEGGKFYKMSEDGAKTINGQLSMLQDAMDNVFNTLGENTEGLIITGIKGVTTLIENYDKLGVAIAGLAASYGLLKASELVELTVGESLVKVSRAKAIALNTETLATNLAAKAQAAFNLVAKANPYVALASAVIAVGTALYVFSKNVNAAEVEQDRLNKRTNEQNNLIQEEKNEIDSLIKKIQDENESKAEKAIAFDTLVKKYPEIFSKYKTEKDLIDNITEAQKLQNAEFEKKNRLLNVGNLSEDQNRLSELQELQRLEKMGGAGRASQGKEGRYSILHDKYGLGDLGLFQSKEGYLENLINEARSTVREDVNKVSEAERKAWNDGISNLTKEQAVAQKEYLEKQKQMLEVSGSGVIQLYDETTMSNADEINRRIGLLDSVVINATHKTAKEFIDEAKKAWDEAEKEVNNIRENYVGNDFDDVLSKAVEKANSAKKLYETRRGKSGTTSSGSGNSADAIAAQNERIEEIERKQAKDRARKAKDLEWQVEQAKIDAKEDGYEKAEAQRKLNNEKEIADLERQKEDYIEAYIQSQEELFNAREELKAKKNKNYQKKTFDRSSVNVDTSAFDAIINETKSRQENEPIKEQERKWNEYLEKYGNYAERRQAIVKRYDEELAKYRENSPEYATLVKERDNELDEFDTSIRNSTNLMAQLFADTSKMSVNEIEKIIEKTELLLQYLNATKDAEGNAVINGTTYNKDSIASFVGVSGNQIDNMIADPSKMKDLTDGLENLKGKLGASSPFLLFKKQINDAAKQIGDKNNKKGVALGIQNIGSAITDFLPTVKEFGNSLGNIFGSSGLGDAIGNIADGIGGLGQTAAGVGQIMSGDIVGGAMSAVNGISAVVSSFEGLFGADYSQYNKMVEEYEGLISVWDEILDRKKEYISISWGDDAVKASEEALNTLQKETDAWRTLGKERLNSGGSIGSHSIGVRTMRNTSESDWQGIASALGLSVQGAKNTLRENDRMTGLFNLSAEQLTRIQEKNVAWWAKLDEDVREYLEKIIAGADAVEEINKMTDEQLTQVSFDSMYDNFISKLMDMGIASKDFADDVSDYFMQAMLSENIGREYQEKLKKWYEKFSNSMQGGLTEAEMNALREEYLGYVNAAIEERDNLAKITGYGNDNYSQEASAKAWGSMTQDMGEELNGRFTAIQISTENIKNIADEIRTVQVNSFMELQQIRENTGAIVVPIRNMASDIKDIKKAVE